MGLESATYVSELNASNPTATDLEAQGDDHLRLLKSVIQATFPGAAKATYIQQAQADVASATSTDLGAATSDFVRITGTTTITGFGTVAAGVRRIVRFEGALILTHNGTSLILPGAASITTAANDRLEAISLGSGNWLVMWFERASGVALAAFASGTISIFGNSTAPTGWTKGSTHNDKAIRLVTGTPSTGGSSGFSSVLTARAISQANLPSGINLNHSLSFSVSNPAQFLFGTPGSKNFALGGDAGLTAGTISNNSINAVLDGVISGTISLGGSGTNLDFAVAYVDMILATKD